MPFNSTGRQWTLDHKYHPMVGEIQLDIKQLIYKERWNAKLHKSMCTKNVFRGWFIKIILDWKEIYRLMLTFIWSGISKPTSIIIWEIPKSVDNRPTYFTSLNRPLWTDFQFSSLHNCLLVFVYLFFIYLFTLCLVNICILKTGWVKQIRCPYIILQLL